MNAARRKSIIDLRARIDKELAEALTTAREAIEAVKELATDLKGEVEGVRDEEQEYYDNMPESLQGGEKGDAAQEAVTQLEDAIEKLEALEDFSVDELDTDVSDITGPMEEAQG